MARKVKATTANVLVCFQTRPGIDSTSVIENVKGKVKIDHVEKDILPQGDKKGFYGLKLDPGKSAELKVFDTTYKVKNNNTEDAEARPNRLFITCWKKPGDQINIENQQRRLQMLGYYTGEVGNYDGPLTEQAMLGFQADNGLRTDGKKGDIKTDETTGKLDAIISKNKDKNDKCFIACRTLVRFTRAPQSDPDKTSGDPDEKAPEVDDRGFKEASAYGHDLLGPVVTMLSGTECRIKVIRECIDDNASLIAVSSDKSVIEVGNANLAKTRNMILKLKAKKLANKNEKIATISVEYKKDGTGKELGSIRVIVLAKIPLKVQPVWVKINSGEPDEERAYFNEAFEICNKIWYNYGVQFTFLPWKKKSVEDFEDTGMISEKDNSCRGEFEDVANAAYEDGSKPKNTVINLYIVNSIEGAYGTTYDPREYNWPTGIALCPRTDSVTTGITLAHEVGHFLGLANCYGETIYIHAEDDPDDKNPKTDLWTFRRLMYGKKPWEERDDMQAVNIGYGDNVKGCMISVRNLPESTTDNELINCREQANSKYVYNYQ